MQQPLRFNLIRRGISHSLIEHDDGKGDEMGMQLMQNPLSCPSQKINTFKALSVL